MIVPYIRHSINNQSFPNLISLSSLCHLNCQSTTSNIFTLNQTIATISLLFSPHTYYASTFLQHAWLTRWKHMVVGKIFMPMVHKVKGVGNQKVNRCVEGRKWSQVHTFKWFPSFHKRRNKDTMTIISCRRLPWSLETKQT